MRYLQTYLIFFCFNFNVLYICHIYFKQPLSRSSVNGKRRWQHYEEIALLDYLKKNRDFEKPCARIYYTKFIFDNKIDIDWRLVRCKTRNMRVAYRRAKEYESKQAESNNCNVEDLRREVLKMCWYIDDFDVLFSNYSDNSIINFSDTSFFDEELSKDETFHNIDSFMAEQTNILNIKKEKQDEDATSIRPQKPEQEKPANQGIIMAKEIESKQNPLRNRTNPVRKWQRKGELALIAFLKKNREFEKPTARIYYTKFIEESGVDIEWHLVRSKVRNMRVAYRKAKELEIKEGDSNNCNYRALRNDILKICWFVDEFVTLFPNDMDNSVCLRAYKTPDPIIDDEFSNNESFFNIDNSSKNFPTTNFLPEEDSIESSSSNSTDENAMTTQTNMSNLKKQSRDEMLILRQKELELAREKLNFEKEKFRQEIRLKEKEIDSEEKLKVMEIQMKERIAIKKLEIEEMLALRAGEKPEHSYNNVYHNLI